MMLIHVDRERALDYLSSCIDQVNSFNEILQLVIVELVYKVSIYELYSIYDGHVYEQYMMVTYMNCI